MNLKIIRILFFVFILFPCMGANLQNIYVGQRFILNQPFKDRNYELVFKTDSVLILSDSFGCQQFYQNANYIVLDSTNVLIVKKSNVGKVVTFGKQRTQTYDQNNNMVISTDSVSLSTDTLHFESQDSLKNGQFIFVRSKDNISDISIKELEEFLIENIGYDNYINDFGNGDIYEARRKLKECR